MARHQSVEDIMSYFEWAHLREPLANISAHCQDLAVQMLNDIPDDSAELTTGLRKLLEAKDCFVRAALPKS